MNYETFRVAGKDLTDCFPECMRVSAHGESVNNVVHMYVPHAVLGDFAENYGYSARECPQLHITSHFEWISGAYVGVLHSASQIVPVEAPFSKHEK